MIFPVLWILTGGDDMCVAMDRSERSYQLLGGYAAGQHLYKLQSDSNDESMHIVFSPHRPYANGEPPRVKLPTLNATTELLLQACDYY